MPKLNGFLSSPSLSKRGRDEGGGVKIGKFYEIELSWMNLGLLNQTRSYFSQAHTILIITYALQCDQIHVSVCFRYLVKSDFF